MPEYTFAPVINSNASEKKKSFLNRITRYIEEKKAKQNKLNNEYNNNLILLEIFQLLKKKTIMLMNQHLNPK